MKLECINISCGYGKKTVLKDINLSVKSGEALCILGPNGVGKTTLFKTLLGFLPKHSGAINLDDKDISSLSKQDLAKSIAYVPQAHIPPFPFLVKEVVLMGRNPHHGYFTAPNEKDKQIATHALEKLGIEKLRDKPYTEISGGERQLVLIARALAQDAKLLLLDEPTASLDFGNQILVLEQIRNIVSADIGVLMTTHSPNHAFLCATRVALLNQNNSIINGKPNEVLTAKNLFETYGVEVHLTHVTAKPGGTETHACIPLLPRQNQNDLLSKESI